MEQLEQRIEYEKVRDRTGRRDPEKEKGPGQHQLHRTVGRVLLALAPDQVRPVHLALTSPQQAIAQAAVRLAERAFLRDYERER